MKLLVGLVAVVVTAIVLVVVVKTILPLLLLGACALLLWKLLF